MCVSLADFYVDWSCRNMYRDHVRRFVNRVNTINGVRYRDDPTILGRGPGGGRAALQLVCVTISR